LKETKTLYPFDPDPITFSCSSRWRPDDLTSSRRFRRGLNNILTTLFHKCFRRMEKRRYVSSHWDNFEWAN